MTGQPGRQGEASDQASAPHRGLRESDLRELVLRLQHAFRVHADELNRLNVFPVADGDTGANLVATLTAVADGLAAEPDAHVPVAVIRHALLGARGNSGIIVSQILRAISDVVRDRGVLDVEGFAQALRRGRDLAYEAVAHPVEGTILTVIRVAADTAVRHAADADDLTKLAAALLDPVREAVRRTPAQLDVLREAGVVDAGARAFELFCDVLHGLAAGHPLPLGTASTDATGPPRVPAHDVPAQPPVMSGAVVHPLEVQYLLDCEEAQAPRLQRALDALGQSVTIAGSDGVLAVHVHTEDAGAAIEASLALGRPYRIRISCLPGDTEDAHPSATSPAKPWAVVAVLPGPGLRAVGEELGARVVEGGGGALPSVGELVDALEATGARRVVILPGHKDVTSGARQAAGIVGAQGGPSVDVVEEADTAPAVLAALGAAAFRDLPDDPADMAGVLSRAAETCASGEVLIAVREAQTPVGPVRKGQPLARARGAVIAAVDDPVEALDVVAAALGAEDSELVTVIAGAAVNAEERRAAAETLAARAPMAAIDWVDGGQQVVRYFIGVE